MHDREKVMEWLNAVSTNPSWWDAYYSQNETKACAEAAIALLKEQEAVKPKSKSRHGEYPQIVHRCGNCNEVLYRHYKHCPTCGRSVKWE